MDKALISGIGNYIKAEILYTCKVNPSLCVRDIPDEILYNIYLAARNIAADAYTDGGASLYTYTGLHGDKSAFKLKLQVYNCKRDPHGNIVETLQTPDKRTTHWVPTVQAPPPAPTSTRGVVP